VRAGTIALIQYVTAILMILLVTWHIILRIPWFRGVENLPATMSPEIIYNEVKTFWSLLLLLSIAVVVHGVNGFRGMLLEWVGGNKRLRFVINILSILVMIALLLVAIYTIVGVVEPG